MINFAASALALLLVLVLAYYVIKAGAKFNGMKQRGNGIQVLESTAIGSRERLVVVSYNNQRYLLGVTGQSVSVVDKHEISPEKTLAQEQPSVLSNKMSNEMSNKMSNKMPNKMPNEMPKGFGLTLLKTILSR